jgi:hypothetical protein
MSPVRSPTFAARAAASALASGFPVCSSIFYGTCNSNVMHHAACRHAGPLVVKWSQVNSCQPEHCKPSEKSRPPGCHRPTRTTATQLRGVRTFSGMHFMQVSATSWAGYAQRDRHANLAERRADVAHVSAVLSNRLIATYLEAGSAQVGGISITRYEPLSASEWRGCRRRRPVRGSRFRCVAGRPSARLPGRCRGCRWVR